LHEVIMTDTRRAKNRDLVFINRVVIIMISV
jgi:hypothetical protein